MSTPIRSSRLNYEGNIIIIKNKHFINNFFLIIIYFFFKKKNLFCHITYGSGSG